MCIILSGATGIEYFILMSYTAIIFIKLSLYSAVHCTEHLYSKQKKLTESNEFVGEGSGFLHMIKVNNCIFKYTD